MINKKGWPSQSQDLNLIENVYFELKEAVYKCIPKDLKDLERFYGRLVKDPLQNVLSLQREGTQIMATPTF
uniref:Uncharacterized protein n=1 Tax=Anguilla anguilla TaxID=7936 RepID=A0A0E9WTC3_ANGAN